LIESPIGPIQPNLPLETYAAWTSHAAFEWYGPWDDYGRVFSSGRHNISPMVGFRFFKSVREHHFKDLPPIDVPVAIHLDGTVVKDSWLVKLKEQKRLVYLSLRKTNISGAGLSELVDLQELVSLDLSGSSVNDDAVPPLVEFHSLKMLNLRETCVTTAAVQKLRNALPRCEIIK
jgi:hypothetical protein